MYSPDVKKKEPVDFYLAKEFEVKVAKFSSLPKIEEVREKIEKNRPLTPSQELLKESLDFVDKNKLSDKKQLLVLKDKQKEVRKDLLKIRRDIQRTKFAVVMGKASWDEFESREEQTKEVNGNEFTVSIREVKVPI
jgi:hypothetical protein